MMEVVYMGPSDKRILTEEDFDAISADHKKTIEFTRGIPVEVSNEVGQALLGHPAVAGSFLAYPEAREAVENATKEQDTSGLLVNLNEEGGQSAEDAQTDSADSRGATGAATTASAARSTGAARATSGRPRGGAGRTG